MDSSEQQQCPILSNIKNIPEEKRKEFQAIYDNMVKSGQHKKVSQQKDDVNSIINSNKSLFQEESQNRTIDQQCTYIENNISKCPINKSDNQKIYETKTNNQPMGCPFFSKEITDPQGKNITRGYPLKYISKLDFIFEDKLPKLRRQTTDQTNSKKAKIGERTSTFLQSLPYLLKHTLFLEEDLMEKMRTLSDSAQLLFIADDTKIKGNKEYDNGNYYKALEVYEQVLGCYVWLDFNDEEERDKVKNQLECKGGTIKDQDVRVRERLVQIESDREMEREMGDGIIVGTIINAMLAYMSLFHFEEADKCAQFILESYSQDPEVYYRKAQIIYFNQKQSFEKLEEANKVLEEFCVNSSKTSKQITQYKELQTKIQIAIEEKVDQELNIAQVILKRCTKQIEALKLQATKSSFLSQFGKQQSLAIPLGDLEIYQVMLIMNEKYAELVQFFRDNQNDIQLQKAINEYQQFAKILDQIQFGIKFDPSNLNQRVKAKLDPVLLETISNPKLNLVIEDAKLEIVDSIFFHSNELNQELYHYAWEKYSEQQQQKKLKQQKEESKKQKNQKDHNKPSKYNTVLQPLLKNSTGINILMFGIISLFMFYFGWEWLLKSTSTLDMNLLMQSLQNNKSKQ